MASSRCRSWVSELTIAAPVPVAATPEAARTLGGTEVDEMPAAAVPGVAGAPPGPPLAEMVGGDGVADRGRSDPKAARFCGGGGANIGPGVPCDVAGAAGGVWLGTGLLAAAGGGAEAGADAGATLVAAGGGVGATGGVVGTDGGSGLPALAARPLVNPCERSLAAVAGVGRPAGVVGVAGMLGVLGMDGIAGGRIGLADMPDAELRGGMIPGLPGPGWRLCNARCVLHGVPAADVWQS